MTQEFAGNDVPTLLEFAKDLSEAGLSVDATGLMAYEPEVFVAIVDHYGLRSEIEMESGCSHCKPGKLRKVSCRLGSRFPHIIRGYFKQEDLLQLDLILTEPKPSKLPPVELRTPTDEMQR